MRAEKARPTTSVYLLDEVGVITAQREGLLEDVGEAEVLALGATRHDHQPGTSFRVFLDPAGHPFCLCLD